MTAPRASVTEVSDDLKVRDAIIRGLPEVEVQLGKPWHTWILPIAAQDMVDPLHGFLLERKKAMGPAVASQTDMARQARRRSNGIR